MASQGTEVSYLQTLLNTNKVVKTLREYTDTPDKSRDLFRKFVNEFSTSKNTIEIYDNWMDNWLPQQVESQSFTEGEYEVKFSLKELCRPMTGNKGSKIPMYPRVARMKNITYEGALIITIKYIQNNKEIASHDVECGSIPIMLGSKKCYLHGKTPDELIAMGECISDPFGYFLIKSEMSLITQEKPRGSLPVVFYGKNGPQCNYPTYHLNGSKIMFISSGKKWNTIKIRIPSFPLKKNSNIKTLPLFVVFFLLTGKTPDQSINMILKFVPDKFHKRVNIYLNDSIIKFNSITASGSIEFELVDYITSRTPKYNDDEETNITVESIKGKLMEELFVDLSTATEKAYQLGFVSAKYILTILGILPYESRDSWAVKKFESAGRSMNMLFGGLFKKVVLITREKFNSNDFLNGFTQKIKANGSKITKEFKDSFNSEVWTVKGYSYKGVSMSGWSRENISNSTDRLTPLSLFSQLDKSNTPTSRQNKSAEMREVQPSQRNRHCPAETPEGENNGLNKYKSILCNFSIECSQEDQLFISDIITEESTNRYGDFSVVLNGAIVSSNNSIAKVEQEFVDTIKELRRMDKRFRYIELYVDTIMKTIEIYTDGSRPTCPYLIVNKDTNQLVIDEIDGWNMSPEELLQNGCVEFISSREEENEDFLLCTSIKRLYKTNDEFLVVPDIYRYSHCNIDPNQMFSTATSVAPMTDRQPGPRNTYQASMGKQAMGGFCLNHHDRFYTTYRVLHRASRSFAETDTYFLPKMDIMPCGQTINVAFMTDPDNQEDAVVVSRDAIDSGILSFFKYVTIRIEIHSASESLCKPSKSKGPKYDTIGEDGFPVINTYINEGDCILGRTRKENGREINASVFTGIGESGYVDKIFKSPSVIKIKLRKFSKYQEGDKEAFRYSQKGTIGRIEVRENLPKVVSGPNEGMTPDLIFNPHGFPSRQTMGILIEGIMTKAALYNGKRVNVSAFRDIDIEGAKQTLEDNGMDPNGYEEMKIPGQQETRQIFFVPLYVQALKHHVADKISMRSSGMKNIYTHQPKGGRTQGGAQKVGEMEKDAFVAHGASGVIIDRMRICSDEFRMVVCNTCGTILGKDISGQYKCTVCDNTDPGILTVSYVFKLLINLLMGMGISVTMNTSKA
jgi:DNA-directed RNA polymerase beta subunit